MVITKKRQNDISTSIQSKSLVYKDKKGQSWWVGIYSNNFEDRHKDAFSWDSHIEYAKWVNAKGIKLPVTFLHQPKYPVEVHLAQFIGLASGIFDAKEFSDNYMKLYAPYAFAQTEAVVPLNGFVFVFAKILNGKEDKVRLLSEVGWGMSHGFLALDRNEDTIDQYRSFEFTSMPLKMAANIVTANSTKESMMDDANKGLSEEEKELFKTALETDPEVVEAATKAAQQILQKVLVSKEVDTEEDVEEDEYKVFRTKIFTDLGVADLETAFKQVVTNMQTITKRMDIFDGRIQQTEKSEDEKIAEQLTPHLWTQLFDEKSGEDSLSKEEKENLKKNAVGDDKLKGVEIADKGGSDDPIQWTSHMLVTGGKS